jgi:hypothetical protein
VTICIAAKSREEQIIAAVTDCLLSFPDFPEVPGLEGAIEKASIVDGRWYTLFAGESPSALSLLRDIKIAAGEITLSRDVSLSLKEVKNLFKKTYRLHFRQRIEDDVLSRLDLDWTAFRKAKGKNEYADIRKDILKYNLRVSFLVFGVDEQQQTQIFTVGNPGIVQDQGAYWAIGIGSEAAFTHMSIRPIAHLPLNDLIYRICETKFATEKVQGIGRDTILFIVSKTLGFQLIKPKYIAQLREVWEQECRKSAPNDALQIIKEALRHATP